VNSYPSWIQKIPRMLQALEETNTVWLDRYAIEKLFGLGKTASVELLKRMGASRTGNALSISKDNLATRLRLAKRDPSLKWEVERRGLIAERIQEIETQRKRKSVVRLAAPLPDLRVSSLPGTVEVSAGRLTIRCASFEDLMRQLVLVAQAADTDFEELRSRIEPKTSGAGGS
jgi:hypothetical protein